MANLKSKEKEQKWREEQIVNADKFIAYMFLGPGNNDKREAGLEFLWRRNIKI